MVTAWETHLGRLTTWNQANDIIIICFFKKRALIGKSEMKILLSRRHNIGRIKILQDLHKYHDRVLQPNKNTCYMQHREIIDASWSMVHANPPSRDNLSFESTTLLWFEKHKYFFDELDFDKDVRNRVFDSVRVLAHLTVHVIGHVTKNLHS